MSEQQESWVPDDYLINAKSVMRMLYAMRDFMRISRKVVDFDTFSYFVEKFEDMLRCEIENAPSQVPVIDFERILEEESDADDTAITRKGALAQRYEERKLY